MGTIKSKIDELYAGEIVTFRSPAKVNLFLRIVGKREDGFHLLRSLFVCVNLFDMLRIRLRRKRGILVKCDNNVVDKDNNSIVKAYSIFCSETGFSKGLVVELEKNIPIGSGLGGASSNAALILRLLYHIIRTEEAAKIDRDALFRMAGMVGADVPFFLYQKPAIISGIGEIIEGVEIDEDLYLVLVYPSRPFYTKKMYEEFDRLNRLTKEIKSDKDFPPFLGYKYIAHTVYNSFEAVLRGEDLRVIMELKRVLIESGADASALSGSGSTVFGLFSSQSGARKASEILSANYPEYLTFEAKVLKGGNLI